MKFIDRIRLVNGLVILAFCLLVVRTKAQVESRPASCLNAIEIKLPLSLNNFSSSKITLNHKKVIAAYYLYQDKYTFWYKIKSATNVTLNFSVLASNGRDKYENVLYEYGGSDFCKALIDGRVKPKPIESVPLKTKVNGQVVYKNILRAKKNHIYYLSVLGLNEDDCGHKIYFKTGAGELSINALHKPCYNVGIIDDIPDYTASLIDPHDVNLTLNLKTLKPKKVHINTSAIKTLIIDAIDKKDMQAGDKLIDYHIAFFKNTYALKPGFAPSLSEVIQFMRDNPQVLVEVQGYMNAINDEIEPNPKYAGKGAPWNFRGTSKKLSELRAKVVRDYLMKHGIRENRLTYRGYDAIYKRFPDPKDSVEAQKNERIEFKVIISGK